MITASFDDKFRETFSKIKDIHLKKKIIKQIQKIKENPEVGKPMKYDRKGSRELYISPFRLSYVCIASEQKVIILDLYHKDKQ